MKLLAATTGSKVHTLDTAQPSLNASVLERIELTKDFLINLPSREFDFAIQSAPSRSRIEVGIKNSEFSDVKYLSSGSNAAVYTGVWNNTLTAIKMLKPNIRDRELAIQEMNIEIQILLKASHPNIINISGVGNKPRKFIVLEYLGGGTLDKLLKKYQANEERHGKTQQSLTQSVGLPWDISLAIAIELASALKYLHHDFHFYAMIIHRDLKPQNIGFTWDMKLKLFDFGLAACVKKKRLSCDTYKMTGLTGTRQYMAPEVALQEPYNEKVDVYSFAILLWQMVTGEEPYSDMTHDEHTQLAMVEGLRPSLTPIVARTPAGVSKILESCWHSKFEQRLDFGSILRDLAAYDDDILGTCNNVSSTTSSNTTSHNTSGNSAKISASTKVTGGNKGHNEEDLTVATETRRKPVNRRRSVALIKY